MTEKECYKTIKKAWGEISEPLLITGKEWYWLHREYCQSLAIKHNLTLQQTAGIFSALSPLKSVSENKRLCEWFLEGVERGHTKLQINKAKQIKNIQIADKIEQVLKGDKTIAFFRHLYTPWNDNYCVNDRHIIKICNKGIDFSITPKRYKIMTQSIQKLAKNVNLHVSETQACLWYLSKQKYGNNI
jgi:hypothetical protein